MKTKDLFKLLAICVMCFSSTSLMAQLTALDVFNPRAGAANYYNDKDANNDGVDNDWNENGRRDSLVNPKAGQVGQSDSILDPADFEADYHNPMHTREVFASLIDDPFVYNPNDLSNANQISHGVDDMYFCRSAADVMYMYDRGNTYAPLSDKSLFLSSDFGDSAYYDCNWVSLDFSIPRGKVLNTLHFWGRNNKDQFGNFYRMGVMLEDTTRSLRHSTTEFFDGSNNFFKFCDDNGTDPDGLQYFNTLTFTDVPSEMTYSSHVTNVLMTDDLLYRANRLFVMHVESMPIGLIVSEMRLAVKDAPVWEIDSLSASVVATDSTVTKDGGFDLSALKTKYAEQVQFKDVWGYDTTGVVTWDDGGFDISAEATYSITGTVGLPIGTVDANSTVETLNDITFDVTVSNGTITAIKEASISVVELFPNPADAMMTVRGLEDASLMKVYSLTGAQVMTRIVSAQDNQVDISSLVSGLYIVKVANQTVKLQVK